MDITHISESDLEMTIRYQVKQTQKKFPLIDKGFLFAEGMAEYAKIRSSLDSSKGSCKAYISTAVYHRLLNIAYKENEYLGKCCKTDCIEVFEDSTGDKIHTLDHEVLREALGCLTVREREAIEARYFNHLSIEECARTMKICKGNVNLKLRRSIEKLKKRLKTGSSD